MSSSFREKFHLRGRDAALVELRGREAIRRHADELIGKRLAPALPHKDGKQTPYRGHPVFVAQHATATCCRSCLDRNHDIPRGRAMRPSWIGVAYRPLGRTVDTGRLSLRA